MAELFEVQKAAISKHLKNIFESGELNEDSVVSKMETTAADGKRYQTNYYNLDAIIAVGYRVNSKKATMKFENGAIGVIDNSRKAVYGYDQRVEVFGSEGCAQNENDIPNTAVLSTADGTTYGTAYKVMWDRYTGAFVAEMQAFADAVANDKETPVTGMDGLYPVLMAAAATKSLHEGRPVKISEVE